VTQSWVPSWTFHWSMSGAILTTPPKETHPSSDI